LAELELKGPRAWEFGLAKNDEASAGDVEVGGNRTALGTVAFTLFKRLRALMLKVTL
jgi:hypothetical protein